MRRILVVAVVASSALLASPAVAAAPGPKLLRFSTPSEIYCCLANPRDDQDFGYRISPNARRVTIAIQKRRCVGCKWRELGRFHASPPHPPRMPTRLYRKLKIGSYRAWARAERGTARSRKQFRRFRVVRPRHDDHRR